MLHLFVIIKLFVEGLALNLATSLKSVKFRPLEIPAIAGIQTYIAGCMPARALQAGAESPLNPRTYTGIPSPNSILTL
jgi:hypothetical protein